MKVKNHVINRKNNLPIVLDYGYKANNIAKPLVIFLHGFKGYKDWGHFNEVMDMFVASNFAFLKFNFSHNGGTPEQPIDFPNLEAFSNNNYIKELNDIKDVVDWCEVNLSTKEVNTDSIYLIGHSRGGAIATIYAAEDNRIKKLITWAAVSDLVNRLPKNEELAKWKKNGVIYIENKRTKQQMPMKYQFVEAIMSNKGRLSVKKAANSLINNIPHLIIHGDKDEAVDVNSAYDINKWNNSSQLIIIKQGTHTFNISHPYSGELSKQAIEVINNSINFFSV